MSRIGIFCCLSLLLAACATAPELAGFRTVQAQSADAPMQTLSREQYISLTVQTIRDELAQNQEAGLQAYLNWGRSQPEYFAGSRNAIGEQLLPALRQRGTRAAEVEALLKTPVQTLTRSAYQPIDFARDQGVHRNKLAEWWYYTGHLYTRSGDPYGYELCYFRVAPVIYFAHVAVTDERHQQFHYQRDYYWPAKTTLATDKASIHYGPMRSDQSGAFAFTLDFPVKDKYHLKLQLSGGEKKPLIINGNGLIDMPEGLDSYYYSLTRLKTSGTLEIDGRSEPVTGQSWMDHQWGHFVALRIGWDWFSFQMEDGSEYNLFGFRKRNGQKLERYVNALIGDRPVSGKGFEIERLAWWRSPHTQRQYVSKWAVWLPQTGERFEVEAVNPDQELAATASYDIAPTYWEGRSRIVKIRPDGSRVQGVGYTEHFDYTRQIGAD